MNHPFQEIDLKAINTIRILSAEMVEAAKSGHPGMPMGAAALAYVLWNRSLNFSPQDPRWPNRDRFVLSAGHGSALLYSLLYLTGYPLTLEQVKKFRQWGSPCAGHPEFGHLAGVETTTGPLGQGFAVAVGMAMAERLLAEKFNRPGFPLFNHDVYCLAGDGCLMEGITSEASSLAGHLGLGKLIALYDSNRISIDGSTELSFTEDVAKRYESYHWQVLQVEGLDLSGMEAALQKARDEKEKPSLIICKTNIGYGSPKKQDTASAHGEPLGEEELRAAKEKLGWQEKESFSVPQDVLTQMRSLGEEGNAKARHWEELFLAYEKKYPEEAKLFRQMRSVQLPEGFADLLPKFGVDDKPVATRAVSGKVINAIAAKMPLLIGGSADLAGSNNTQIKDEKDFSRTVSGRNIRFGVREHAMGAILNGLAHSELIIPYGGTFLIFSDYMRPSIRLAALMGLPVVYVFTHDSIFLGEDGPTHQPIEHLASLRAIPNLRVLRPADAQETVAAWHFALKNRKLGPQGTPVALCLTRQALPILPGTKSNPEHGLAKGGYVVRQETKKLELLLIATGSEVEISCKAAEVLEGEGIGVRVISMPCRELFLQQQRAYQEEILPAPIKKRLVIEAAVVQGWEGMLGEAGEFLGMNRFGASAPAAVLAKEFGFTAERIVQAAKRLIDPVAAEQPER